MSKNNLYLYTLPSELTGYIDGMLEAVLLPDKEHILEEILWDIRLAFHTRNKMTRLRLQIEWMSRYEFNNFGEFIYLLEETGKQLEQLIRAKDDLGILLGNIIQLNAKLLPGNRHVVFEHREDINHGHILSRYI